MPDRVFIIHRWDGSPHTDWYKWLANALKEKGFEAFVPKMPDPAKPAIGAWVDAISQSSRYIDESTYMVGHSIGCQAILRFLQGSQSGRIKGMLLIAPWLHLKDAALGTESDRITAKPWLETPIDFGAIKGKVGSTRIIMAKEDPYVPVEDSKIFRAGLDAKVNIMPLKVHFTEDDGYKELHVALNEFMKLVNDA
ncbi:MAG: alpha/beta hydrolase [Candidatus Marsarchaeota archaeon]|jgi:predicted alpha/beta hydrolase family esterase|nr:alpha/beta hydrolase [Candidatus Marsarchaeota archaeon]